MRFFQSTIHQLVLLACLNPWTPITAQHNDRLPDADVALALGGGGFLSVTDMAGLTSGLLSVLMKQNSTLIDDDDALANSGLFNRVGSISSISGGSWFAAKLAYSKDFRTMIEDVAKAQATSDKSIEGTLKVVRDAYNAMYTSKTLAIAEVGEDTELFKKLESFLAPLTGFGALPEEAKQSLAFLATLKAGDKAHFSWSDVTGFVLNDIPPTATIGDPVEAWAQDKNWKIIVSAVTPKENIFGPDMRRLLKANRLYNDGENFLEYTVDVGPENKNLFETWVDFVDVLDFLPPTHPKEMLLPASFSAVLGCRDCAAPYPFDSSSPGLLETYEVQYAGKNSGKDFTDKGAEKSVGMDAFKLNGKDNFSDTPIHGPVGASSAFVGALTLSEPVAELFQKLKM